MRVIPHPDPKLPKLLLNENVPLAAYESLESNGVDVKRVGREIPGGTDLEVIDLAVADGRVLVTCDKDFGQLVFKEVRSDVKGVILLRFKPRTPSIFGPKILNLLREYGNEILGSFVVVEESRIRIRPLLNDTAGA